MHTCILSHTSSIQALTLHIHKTYCPIKLHIYKTTAYKTCACSDKQRDRRRRPSPDNYDDYDRTPPRKRRERHRTPPRRERTPPRRQKTPPRRKKTPPPREQTPPRRQPEEPRNQPYPSADSTPMPPRNNQQANNPWKARPQRHSPVSDTEDER